MATRRQRRRFPELPAPAQLALEEAFEELRSRLAALEAAPVAPQVITADFTIRPGQTLIIDAPAAGINGSFVAPRETLRGARAVLVFQNANPVRLSCTNGLVNGLPRVLSNAAGTFTAICDGKTGWALDQGVGAAGVAGAPGTPGAPGSLGPMGPPGRMGYDGRQGPPGPQGPQGPAGADGAPGGGGAGSAGPPGRAGYDGRMGYPGPQGLSGAAGPPGADGAVGPPGRMGYDGRQGVPGPAGAAGSPGATGANGSPGLQGPPGRIEYGWLPRIPGPQGATGPAGSGGGGGSAVLATATVNLGSVPQWSGNFEITGLSGLTIGQAVLVSRAVLSSNPSEAEEQLVISGIVTSATTITCQWEAVNGPVGGNVLVQYLVASSVGAFGDFSRGRQLGLQIDSASDAPPVQLTGLEQGENIRFGTGVTETATGDLGATSYVIDEPTTYVIFENASPLIIHGISMATFLGLGVTASGRRILLIARSTSAGVVLRHNSSTEATAARRIQCPGGADFHLTPNSTCEVLRTPTPDQNRIIAANAPQHHGSGYLVLRDDFTGGGFGEGVMGETGWSIHSSADAGSNIFYTPAETGHPGIVDIQAAAVANARCSITRHKQSSALVTAIRLDQLQSFEWVVRPIQTTAHRIIAGVAIDPIGVTGVVLDGGSHGIYCIHDPGISGNWIFRVRTSGANTDVGTGVPVVAASWYTMRFRRRTSGLWSLEINDSGTISLFDNAGTPFTGGVNPCVTIQTTAAVNKFVDADYFEMTSQNLSRSS